MTVGYSGTPLIKKLGFKDGMEILVENPPPEYLDWLGKLPQGACVIQKMGSNIAAAHIFCYEKSKLLASLTKLRKKLAQEGFVWVSWPKKSSKVPTDITEDVIREIALPMGFVDIKVCAVSEVWSGLKLVIRKSERI
jgi:Protein of unknown function (DUF3052)